jgi:hypothetical protein
MKRGRSRAAMAKRLDEVARAASPQKPARRPGRDFEEIRERDPDGVIVVHSLYVDTLGRMLKSGTISSEMHDAARDFQAAFVIANLDRLRAVPVLRVPGTGREPDLNERQLDAKRRVHEAMEALGGISSPAGSCIWHVLGLQRSIREWSLRMGWGGYDEMLDAQFGHKLLKVRSQVPAIGHSL